MAGRIVPTREERFWSKVDRSGGPDACWPWSGAVNGDGYGQMYHDGTHRFAHRISWQIEAGEIPRGMMVCHKCDNPPCCNPAHLFLGTTKDNALDMMRKGRGRYQAHPGERNGFSKLTEDAVRDIRKKYATGATQREIAKEFGVCGATVHYIVSGAYWKHIIADQSPRKGEERANA